MKACTVFYITIHPETMGQCNAFSIPYIGRLMTRTLRTLSSTLEQIRTHMRGAPRIHDVESAMDIHAKSTKNCPSNNAHGMDHRLYRHMCVVENIRICLGGGGKLWRHRDLRANLRYKLFSPYPVDSSVDSSATPTT